MIGYIDFLFLSYGGRIGRTAYWVGLVVLGLAEFGAIIALLNLAHGSLMDLAAAQDDPRTVTPEIMMHVVLPALIVSVLFLYPTFALYTKRWHDRNKSGWWSLVGLVPIIGGLWMFVELGFLGGDEGQNDFGDR